MGLFCVSMHSRTTDDTGLSRALSRRGLTEYRVLTAKNGWVSLYEAEVSAQDDDRIRELAGGLSTDLHVAAIAFMVHDSDIACYWLYDDGRLLDQYNSCPDYFDDGDEPSGPAGGRPDVLVRYCRAGVSQDDLAAILAQETVFADDVIAGLAAALGIDVKRALSDYRDIGGPEGPDGDDLDDDGGEDSGGPTVSPPHTGLLGRVGRRMTEMLGGGPCSATADPQATALVKAAARGDTEEMDQLLGTRMDIDAEAPAPLPGGQPMAGLGQLFPRGVPEIAMTPLLAAVAHKRRRAAERLLDAGADPNRAHPLFGTAVHVATGTGDVDLLRLLVDRGGDVHARSAQGQTPLGIIEAGRTTPQRMAEVEKLMKLMGKQLSGPTAELPIEKLLSDLNLPTEGWEACERLLKACGAK